MIPVIAIRPEPGCSATVKLGEGMGLRVAAHPLFCVEPVSWSVTDVHAYDAVLFGSGNSVRHAGPALADLTALPAFCVGETTADAARKAGFDVVATGTGGLQDVLPQATRLGCNRLLRLSGEAHVPLDPPAAVRVDTVVCYRVAALPVDAVLAAGLRQGALVLLHSGEAAAHFEAEVDRLGMARSSLSLACLAPRIANRAGDGWARLATAPTAEDAALLALALQMCQA